ncbi:TIGR01777 family oxidoreductase [Aquimarina aquimarini]|uniref:TIGR01777 family oxidoreductase n=1 Tax=Aquimarina aquimarini TaxID=1191734 RepID=UPI000D550196|nr:TIGR01777 family oxidoreductase [Aquimarina aquimarini]
MKVLITGATGLIGQEIVSLCHQANFDVNYLSTSKQKLQSLVNYKGFYWNPKEREIDTNCFQGVEVIINLAGATVAKRWTSSYKKEILESRIHTTSLILKTLQNTAHNVRHIISASAIGIYPDSFQNYYMEDSDKKDTGFLGEIVTQWENAVMQFKTIGVDVSILRIGLVLSEKGGAFPKMAKPIQLGLGAFFGHGKQWQSWIHVKDLARMFMFIAQEKLIGVYNAVSPNPISNKKLTRAIAKKYNKKIVMPSIPRFMMKLMLGEMYILLFSSQRVCSDKVMNSGFYFEFGSITQAIDVLVE